MSAQNNKIKVITLDLDNTLWDVEATIIVAEKNMRLWMQDNVPDALTIYKSDATAEIRSKVVADNPTQIHDLTFLRIEVLFRIIAASGVASETSSKPGRKGFCRLLQR